jgi:hypothetical protein
MAEIIAASPQGRVGVGSSASDARALPRLGVTLFLATRRVLVQKHRKQSNGKG